jgi:hypothetical protein
MKRIFFCGLAFLLILAAVAGTAARVGAQPGPGWFDTGITAPTTPGGGPPVCFDALHPGVLLLNEAGTGTVAYHWTTGARETISAHGFRRCGPNGLLYDDATPNTVWRFSTIDRAGQAIAHLPRYMAEDGTLQVYAAELVPPSVLTPIWASPDGGVTWHQIAAQWAGNVTSLAVSAADARAIYVLVEDMQADPMRGVPYQVYFSPDAGQTWQERLNTVADTRLRGALPNITLETAPGHTAPVDTVIMRYGNGGGGSGGATSMQASNDGGRSFHAVELIMNLGFHPLELVHSQEGLIKSIHGLNVGTQTLTLTTDAGQTWQSLPLPDLPPLEGPPGVPAKPGEAVLTVAPAAPANLFLAGQGLWQSADNGHSWQQLGTEQGRVYAFSPYLPLALLWQDASGRLFVRELPDAGKTQTARVLPSGAPGSVYFPATGHNLPEVFKRYWEDRGGLAQFGYPRTEPFLEVNAADGRPYLAQYYERNRFEYHPEYAGTTSEVLLGLLGNQLTAARRAAGEAPFNPVPHPNQEGVLFFTETGHTLRGPFRTYWEAHGGLPLYGYPISEEFSEVNPDNGQAYTVQYFERNRFEYHPEYRGSPYEVLLGLLGNTLLREKGW